MSGQVHFDVQTWMALISCHCKTLPIKTNSTFLYTQISSTYALCFGNPICINTSSEERFLCIVISFDFLDFRGGSSMEAMLSTYNLPCQMLLMLLTDGV